MAEALLKHYVDVSANHAQGENWSIASAGCWAYPGMAATSRAVSAAENLGGDLIDHSAQSVNADLLNQFNLILCMEQGHIDFINRHFPEAANKVFLLTAMVNEDDDIDDPVGKSQSDYDQTASQILTIIRNGWERIKDLSQN